MRGILVPLALVLAVSTACSSGLSQNNKTGIAVVGGMSVVMGGTLLVDGMSCDQENWNGHECAYDGDELRNGALLTLGGAALVTWGLLMLAGDDDAPEAGGGTRTAKNAAGTAK